MACTGRGGRDGSGQLPGVAAGVHRRRGAWPARPAGGSGEPGQQRAVAAGTRRMAVQGGRSREAWAVGSETACGLGTSRRAHVQMKEAL